MIACACTYAAGPRAGRSGGADRASLRRLVARVVRHREQGGTEGFVPGLVAGDSRRSVRTWPSTSPRTRRWQSWPRSTSWANACPRRSCRWRAATSAVVKATAKRAAGPGPAPSADAVRAGRGARLREVFRDIFAAEGLGGFSRGIIPEYAPRWFPGVSITYMTYELLKRSIAWTPAGCDARVVILRARGHRAARRKEPQPRRLFIRVAKLHG